MTALPEMTELEPTYGIERDAEPARTIVLTTAELAECTCPEFCERDHGNE